MAGRIDEAAHGAAVARVGEIVPHHSAIREHLQVVLASSEFRGSRRSQEFLLRVVEHALNGEFDSLKERLLGMSIFGRDASYDTGEDSIVRVTASDVRRRLKQYYAVNKAAAFRIELPAGSYIPEFHCDENMLAEVAAESAAATEKGFKPSIPLPVADTLSVVAELDPSDGSSVRKEVQADSTLPQRRRKLIHSLLFPLGGLLLLAAGWRVGRIQQVASPSPAIESNVDYSFYKELLGPIATDTGMNTDIVITNPHILLYKGSSAPVSDAGNYYSRKVISVPTNMERDLNEDANDDEAGFPYHHLEVKTTSYTGTGEAEAAFQVRGLLDTLGRASHLTEARFLSWDSARNQHVIFLGAPYTNAWTKKNLSGQNFTMEHDAIVNAQPLGNEPRLYKESFHNDVLEDYGLMWMSDYPSGSRILVLAGLSSAGTEGVSNFFSNPTLMKPVYEKLKAATRDGSIPANWQIIVRINARDNVPLNVSFVSLRVLPSDRERK